jgi:hypothetical protein
MLLSTFALVFIAFALVDCTVARAQDQASLTGVVTDSSGAVIPNVTVTLTNTLTGEKFVTKTDALGTYRFTSIPAKSGYKESFSHEGFGGVEISDISLAVGTVRTQSVQLKPGKDIQTVLVSAIGQEVTLDTTNATIGNSISIQQLDQLPVYDRTAGISTLFVQQPGVDWNSGAVTGARTDQSSVTVDGLDVNDIASGATFRIIATAPVDSVEQFTGSVSGEGSEIGTGAGGQFQLVTKTGTNKFHGNINEYHRDTTTVANTWFNNLTGLPRTPLIQNQFGGDIGGPIKHDKLFFYFDYTGSRIVQSTTEERTVPLDAFRAGTLNYINNGSSCGATSRLASQPSCISTASATTLTSLDPGSKGFDSNLLTWIKARYPEANDTSYGDGVNTGGYRFTAPTPDNRDSYVGTLDYVLTPTQKITGRLTITRRDAIETVQEFKTDPVTHPYQDRSYAYVVNHTWNIGSTKVNQLYYGDTIAKLNFPDVYNPTGIAQYSFSSIDGPYTAFDGQKRRVPIPMVRDDFSWQRGRHSLTLGGTFKFIKTNSNLINNFNFVEAGMQGSALSNGFDSAVRPTNINTSSTAKLDYDELFADGLGVVGAISSNFTYSNKLAALPMGAGGPRAYRYFQTEAYFGDVWKISPRLTLDFGLRYQFYSVPFEAHGNESVLTTDIPLSTYVNDRIAQQKVGNTSTTGLPLYTYGLGGKVNNGPNLYDPSYKDFAPRVGFSYSPFADNKTILRGSVGIQYDRTVVNAVNFLQDQLSYLFSNSATNQFGSTSADASLAADDRLGSNLSYPTADNPTAPTMTSTFTPYVDGSGTPYGLPSGESGMVIPKGMKDPYNIDFTLGIQRDLPWHMVLKADYTGHLGRRLLASADGSQVIDVPDYTGGSTQTMSQAFAALTTQMRAGADYTTVTDQPWFHDVMGRFSAANRTKDVAYFAGYDIYNGDISDALYTLAGYTYYYYPGFLPVNIGIPWQFGTNAYLTNMGNSNYHGLMVTLDKNVSNGLRYEFNYTLSHSIDNTSLTSNNNPLTQSSPHGFICDILNPRACRGDSDFDTRQAITSNYNYDLPFGKGKQFAATVPHWADEAIGQWSFSGLIAFRTGLPITAYADAYLASFDNNDPAIFSGDRSKLKAHVNVDHSTNTVYMFDGGSTGAAKAASYFRGPIGLEYGQRNYFRGPRAFTFDASLGKIFPVWQDKVNLKFQANAYNVFNHPNFGSGGMHIVNNASNFGQITGMDSPLVSSGARVAQFSLRLDF